MQVMRGPLEPDPDYTGVGKWARLLIIKMGSRFLLLSGSGFNIKRRACTRMVNIALGIAGLLMGMKVHPD